MLQTVYDKLFEYFGVYVPGNKYPLCVTCINLPPDCIDVNLEPNKTRVYLKNQVHIFQNLFCYATKISSIRFYRLVIEGNLYSTTVELSHKPDDYVVIFHKGLYFIP